MALLDFIKEAGEKLFRRSDRQSTQPGQQTQYSPPSSQLGSSASGQGPAGDITKAAEKEAEDAILNYIKAQKLDAIGLLVTFDSVTATATVYGVAPDQATKEKIILCCGNVAGVARVDDRMSVDQSAPEAQFYTVKSGDTLSKIAKEFYDDANQYAKIFEANRPMLSHPDKIYPGQTLRIPPA